MWKEFMNTISANYLYNEPASREQMEEIKKRFKVDLSHELESFLLETNGVQTGEYGYDIVWPASRIIEENSTLRNNEIFKDVYMPFDSLLFVADAGNGDLFGYSILNGSIQKDDIFAWNHEDDSRKWVAPSLKKFLEWLEEGKIRT